MQPLPPVIQCRRGKKVPKGGNSTDFGRVFSSTLTASRSFAAVIAAGEAYLVETARANRLKEPDSRPTRPYAAVAGTRKAATKERDTADSEGKSV